MKRHPFSSEGIRSLQADLYRLRPVELRAEAKLLAEDPVAWIARHIELEVRQLECFRNIKEDFMLMLGWHIAAAVLDRKPVDFKHIKDANKDGAEWKACILHNSKFSCHFSTGDIVSAGGLDIIYIEPLP